MSVRINVGDVREQLGILGVESVDCCVTSPPYYGLRSYLPAGHANKAKEIGQESTLDDYIAGMVSVFADLRPVLKSTGTFWLNLGDSYAGSWGAQSRGDPSPDLSTLSGGQIYAAPKGTHTGSLKNAPGYKPKDLMGVPWRVAFALQSDGWYLRDAIIWAKPNGMPGSQVDRCTSSYEMVFQFSKSEQYYSDFDAIKTPPRESTLIRTAQDVQAQAGSHRANGGAKTNGTMKAVGGAAKRDKQRGHSRRHEGFNQRWDAMKREQQMAEPAMMRNVWFISPASYSEAHFAVMPDELARRCILAGCPPKGLVLDPFSGAATVPMVADRLGRDAIGIELFEDFAEMGRRRIKADAGMFSDVA